MFVQATHREILCMKLQSTEPSGYDCDRSMQCALVQAVSNVCDEAHFVSNALLSSNRILHDVNEHRPDLLS